MAGKLTAESRSPRWEETTGVFSCVCGLVPGGFGCSSSNLDKFFTISGYNPDVEAGDLPKQPGGVIRLKKWMLVGLAVVILAGLAGIAAAAPDNAPAGPGFRAMGPRGAGMMGCGMGGPMGTGGGLGVSKMIKDLGLTDDQIARMRAIQAEASTRTGSLQASMWQKMSELRDLNWTREPDKDAIKAKQNEINELRKQMAEIQKQMLVDMQNVLTQEQKDKMGNLREAARRDFGGRGMRMKRYPGGNKAPSADSEGASTNSRIS